MTDKELKPKAVDEADTPKTPDATAPAEEPLVDDNDLSVIQGDLDRFRDLALRTQADFDNFRKRAAREREDAVRYANASIVERLIPILDNFELGLGAAKGDSSGGAILSGMEMVLKQLQDLLAQHGVEVVDATGKPFDPNLHEAIAQEESDETPEGHVIRQLRKGYKLKDRLLRAANVIVSKGQPA